jgi:hypothetical protein
MPLPEEILEVIPEEYRDHKSLEDFKDVGELAKSFVETKALVGNSIRIPSADAGPEAQQEFWQKLIDRDDRLMLKPDFTVEEQSQEFFRTLGQPEEPSGYENPEELSLPEDVEAEMREILHPIGLTKIQYKKVMEALNKRHSDTLENLTTAHTEDITKLKEKWGMATEERMTAAKEVFKERSFFPNAEFEKLSSAQIEALYDVHVALTGKGAQAASQQDNIPATTMTPDEALTQAKEIMDRARNDPNMSHEERMKLMNKGMELKIKYAGREGSLDSLRA